MLDQVQFDITCTTLPVVSSRSQTQNQVGGNITTLAGVDLVSTTEFKLTHLAGENNPPEVRERLSMKTVLANAG